MTTLRTGGRALGAARRRGVPFRPLLFSRAALADARWFARVVASRRRGGNGDSTATRTPFRIRHAVAAQGRPEATVLRTNALAPALSKTFSRDKMALRKRQPAHKLFTSYPQQARLIHKRSTGFIALGLEVV